MHMYIACILWYIYIIRAIMANERYRSSSISPPAAALAQQHQQSRRRRSSRHTSPCWWCITVTYMLLVVLLGYVRPSKGLTWSRPHNNPTAYMLRSFRFTPHMIVRGRHILYMTSIYYSRARYTIIYDYILLATATVDGNTPIGGGRRYE